MRGPLETGQPSIHRVLCPSSLNPPLPILPVFACAVDIRVLPPLVACAKQQDYLASCDCVVDSVSRPDIDPQFPHAIAAKLMVSEVPQFESIDAPVEGDPCLGVTELAAPLEKWVSAVQGEVVANLVHGSLSSINEYRASEFVGCGRRGSIKTAGRYLYDRVKGRE